MSSLWLRDVEDLVAAHGAVVRVSVVRADGSAPRGPGAAMVVTAGDFSGTVGGGALELEALHSARRMLRERHAGPWQRRARDFPLGPALGQCCGGYVELLYEILGETELAAIRGLADRVEADALVVRPLSAGGPMEIARHRKDDGEHWPLAVRDAVRKMLSGILPSQAVRVEGWYVEPLAAERTPLFVYGAGHVGRAVVKVLADLPFDVYWVDTDANRYPDALPAGVHRLVSTDPAEAVKHAPAGAWHVVMSYSHAIDFNVCQAVLAGGDFGYLGVIASRTKRARFVRGLIKAGLPEAAVSRLHAPIGLPGLDGKEPAMIAVSVAADLLLRLQEVRETATLSDRQEAEGET